MVNNAGMELRMGKFHFKSFGLYTILLAVIALCVVYTPPIAVRQVSASPPGTEVIMINPATGNTNFTFYIEVTQTGTRFNATVWLYNVTDLFAFQVYLAINDTLLNITNAWVPSWDSSYVFYGKTTVPTIPTFYDDDADGVYESVLVGTTILGTGSFTGSGLLAIIELEIIHVPETGEETTNLNINNPDTILLDPTLSDIEATKTDGLYRIVGAPALPIPPARLYVSPTRISDPNLTPCRSFSIGVNIENATNLYTFMFNLNYDQTIITVDNATAGDFFPAESYTITIDNLRGILTVSAQLTPPEEPRSGNGNLITVYFHVEAVGASSISLSDVALLDEQGKDLPYTSEDGFFSNVFMAKLSIEPENIISPDLMPSHVFDVNVTIDDVENLYGYEFTLTYNTEMLTFIGMYVYPVNNQSAFTTLTQSNDLQGWLWINVTFYEPAIPFTTYEPQPLVRLYFIVENVGSSLLHFEGTSLVNSTGQLIPHGTSDGYVQTLIRDVAVTNVEVSPDWVYEGWIVNISVTVKNLGNVSETFDVMAYYDDALIGVETVIDLAPNAETTLLFSWNTSGVEEGIYTIKGEASAVPYEFNLENNIYVDGTVEVRAFIRDVAVTAISAYPDAVYPGWPVNVSVTIRNEGNLTENVTVTIYFDSEVMADVEATNLAPNEERTMYYVWNTTGLPECSNYTISAEVTPLPYEIDLEDNYLTDGYVKIKIYGDINGDNKVDIYDVAIVAYSFGSYPGHPRWNPEADLNRDESVDIRDVAIVASNFGRTC